MILKTKHVEINDCSFVIWTTSFVEWQHNYCMIELGVSKQGSWIISCTNSPITCVWRAGCCRSDAETSVCWQKVFSLSLWSDDEGFVSPASQVMLWVFYSAGPRVFFDIYRWIQSANLFFIKMMLLEEPLMHWWGHICVLATGLCSSDVPLSAGLHDVFSWYSLGHCIVHNEA